MKPPIFIASFLKRYWRLLIVFVILVVLGKIDAVTYFVGPIFYLVELAVGATVAALFLRHAFLRQTLDTYSQDNPDTPGGDAQFVIDWNALDGPTKVKLTLGILSVFFLGCCWICAAIAH